jgi:hypothetical protein
MDAVRRVAHPDQAQARKKTVREPAGAGANGYGEKVSSVAISCRGFAKSRYHCRLGCAALGCLHALLA